MEDNEPAGSSVSARRKRIDCAGNLDPKRVDLADKPQRTRKVVTREREPMPDWLRPWAEAAAKRKLKRPPSPAIIAEPRGVGDGCQVELISPHADEDAWWDMLGDAFGTRSLSVIQTFVSHLSGLTAPSLDRTNECWKPNEQHLNAALAILHASRPQNEVDAMLAANAVALHWLQMKAASYVLKNNSSFVDTQMAAATARLARAFVHTVEALDRRKRKKRASRQVITVKRETHYHQHKHVHLEGGGVQIGDQPDATERELIGNTIERAAIAADGAQMPSACAHNRRKVPSESGSGQACVPDARRRKGRRCTKRQS